MNPTHGQRRQLPLIHWFSKLVKPRSRDPEESVRERAIRIALPLVALIRILLALIQLSPAEQSQWYFTDLSARIVVIIAMFIPIVICEWALRKQRITLAGIALVSAWLFTDVLGAYSRGFWLSNVQLSFVLDMILSSIVLPTKFILPYGVILIASFNLITFTSQLTPIVDPALGSDPASAKTDAALVLSPFLVLGLIFMNFMKGELIKQIEALSELVNTLEIRVADRTRDLDAARIASEQANQIKSQFLAAMSHELRTPLNSIINYSYFIQEGLFGKVNTEQADAAGNIMTSGQHLLSLINDVLDISKIESGALQLFIEDGLDITAELHDLAKTAKALLANKEVEVRLDLQLPLPTISGDRLRIRQIILNLISNACKFTDHGSITLYAHPGRSNLIVAVSDTGPGISKEDFEIVFETFRQTEVGLRKGGGTGLGLSIARRLTEAHGGTLTITSTLGQGSTFTVSLPIKSTEPVSL